MSIQPDQEFALDRVTFRTPDWAETGDAEVPGARVKFGRPRVAVESSDRCWYPDLLRFSTGELLLSYSLNEDSNTSLVTAQAVLLSDDDGQTWGKVLHEYDVNGFHNGNGEIRWSTDDGTILGMGTYVQPDPPGQMRRFAAHHWKYDKGGRRYTVEPWGATIEGLPRSVRPWSEEGAGNRLEAVMAFDERWDTQSRWWGASLNAFGEAIALGDGSVGTPISLRFDGDDLESTVFIVSSDDGYTWTYRATMTDQHAVPGAIEGFDEASLVRLEDGRLLCVSRVGDSQALYKTYSNDDGHSWSSPVKMDAWSVAPAIRRLDNGVLVLVTGRPGIYLWVCTDGVGDTWHPLEIVEGYHNAVMPANQRILHGKADVEFHEHLGFQTSSYVAMLEIQPNHVLIAYDRAPFGWTGSPRKHGSKDRGQIFLLNAVVERQG